MLDEKAADLLNEGAFLRQTKPVPVERMSAEYLQKAQALNDSAARIRADLEVRQGSITPLQAGLLARLERNASELQTRARLLGQGSSSAAAQAELYGACVLVYGAGARFCDQLRVKATPPPATTP